MSRDDVFAHARREVNEGDMGQSGLASHTCDMPSAHSPLPRYARSNNPWSAGLCQFVMFTTSLSTRLLSLPQLASAHNELYGLRVVEQWLDLRVGVQHILLTSVVRALYPFLTELAGRAYFSRYYTCGVVLWRFIMSSAVFHSQIIGFK